jgi:arylformamidase
VLKFDKIFDISVCLGTEEITYPGDPEYKRETMSELGKNGAYELSRLTLSSHSGTHIDAPAHFIKNGKKIHELSLREFIQPACVIDIHHTSMITVDELKTVSWGPAKALLFKTENSRQGKISASMFTPDYVYLAPEAALYCLEKKITLVGIDYITIDKSGGTEFGSHNILLGHGVIILESIDLKDVPPGQYTLLCLPLKIYDGEASPVRAVLLQ